ncbi:MAG: hypothetical protein JWO44_2265 [Bacteroidetes bacterium]|nr:hypothetical protein [Bacteroidota bacterium]
MPYIRNVFLLLFFTAAHFLHAQSIKDKLAGIPGAIVSQLSNSNFKEYYEVLLDQPIDHTNPASKLFRQRIIIGINSIDSAVVMDTDGYAINYALNTNYRHELASLLNANLVLIEHRYFGHSVPDSMDYNFLTTKQAAEDVHLVKLLLSPVLKGKWISTGISKGGQAALAHRMYYPADAVLTIVYGTAVKKALNETRIDSMLNALSETACGKKLEIFQSNLLKNKPALIHSLEMYADKNEMSFGMDMETVLDYMILELPFSFWQTGCSCDDVHLVSKDPVVLFEGLVAIIPPSFYSAKTMKRLQPAFYMNYHELGYYEYNSRKFRSQLKQKAYPNSRFAPQDLKFSFDDSYLAALGKFLTTKDAEQIVFIYGENDPWSAMQQAGKAKKFIIRKGSHKSRIADLDKEQKDELFDMISKKLR